MVERGQQLIYLVVQHQIALSMFYVQSRHDPPSYFLTDGGNNDSGTSPFLHACGVEVEGSGCHFYYYYTVFDAVAAGECIGKCIH